MTSKLHDTQIAGFSTGLNISLNDYFSIKAAYEKAAVQPDHFPKGNHIVFVSGEINIAQPIEKLLTHMLTQ